MGSWFGVVSAGYGWCTFIVLRSVLCAEIGVAICFGVRDVQRQLCALVGVFQMCFKFRLDLSILPKSDPEEFPIKQGCRTLTDNLT